MERDLQKLFQKKMGNKSSANTLDNQPKLWVVGSGKGGVGKTFVSTSLGITLSKLGHSVIIVDLDLSGANVHTTLGLQPSHANIRQFFENGARMQELVIQTSFANLSYIQGFWDSWTPTEFAPQQVEQLIPALKSLKADYVVVDIGAGATFANLELFKSANEKFMITTPEPTSIEKTYRFIEAHLCHALRENSTPESYQSMIDTLRMHRQRKLGKPFSFRSYLKENSGLHFDLFENLSTPPIRLLINSARSQSQSELGYSMKSVCNRYFDLGIDYLGAIDYDNAVWQSVQQKEHVLSAQPFTPIAGQFLATCKHLIDPDELRAVV